MRKVRKGFIKHPVAVGLLEKKAAHGEQKAFICLLPSSVWTACEKNHIWQIIFWRKCGYCWASGGSLRIVFSFIACVCKRESERESMGEMCRSCPYPGTDNWPITFIFWCLLTEHQPITAGLICADFSLLLLKERMSDWASAHGWWRQQLQKMGFNRLFVNI